MAMAFRQATSSFLSNNEDSGISEMGPYKSNRLLSSDPVSLTARVQAHPLNTEEFFLLDGGMLKHMPDKRVILSNAAAVHDFAVADANTAYVLTDQGVHRLALSLSEDGGPAVLSPALLNSSVFQHAGSTPRRCAWDASRQILYICSSCGDIASWSPAPVAAAAAPPRLLARLRGFQPLQLAVEEAAGWLVILLSQQNTFAVINASGDIAILESPRADSVLGFCILPAERSDARMAATTASAAVAAVAAAVTGGWRRQPDYKALVHKGLVLCSESAEQRFYAGFQAPLFVQQVTPHEARQLAADMGGALSRADTCDVTLTCSDGRCVPAHRAILAARFPFFGSLFSGRWPLPTAPSPLTAPSPHTADALTPPPATPAPPQPAGPALSKGPAGAPAPSTVSVDAPSDVVRSLLRWGYTAALDDLDAANAPAVATLADLWCVNGAKALCEAWLIGHLDGPNLADCLQLADRLAMAALRAAAIERIAADWGKLPGEVQTGLAAALAPALLVEVISAVSRKRPRRD